MTVKEYLLEKERLGIKVPRVGEAWEWGGKVRGVSKFSTDTEFVYFTDGTRAKFSKRMKHVPPKDKQPDINVYF